MTLLLALGMTQLLATCVSLFRARGTAPRWTGCLFVRAACFAGVVNDMLVGLAIGFLCVFIPQGECVISVLFAIVDFGTAFLIG